MLRRCGCATNGSSATDCQECNEKQGRSPSPYSSVGAATRRLLAEPTGQGHDFSRVRVHSPMEQASATGNREPGDVRSLAQLEKHSDTVKERPFFCPPVADSITAISAAAKGGGTLGFTKIDQASQLICSPRFTVDTKAGNCTFQPVAVSLSLTSKFAKAGAAAPTSDSLKLPECGNKDVPIYMEITPAISTLAQQGEQEHCDDLTISFNQTLLPCSTALNKFAGQKIPGKSDADCFQALKAKLGFDPDQCTLEFVDLTKKDDERDSKGFHDFDPVVISKDCTKIVIGNKKASTNKIGDPSVAPAKLIPASAKCPKAAPASPTTTTTAPTSSGSGGVPNPPPKEPKNKE